MVSMIVAMYNSFLVLSVPTSLLRAEKERIVGISEMLHARITPAHVDRPVEKKREDDALSVLQEAPVRCK
jgi:hypothetical protein